MFQLLNAAKKATASVLNIWQSLLAVESSARRALGGRLFELLKVPSHMQHLPLLQLDGEEIMERPDCHLDELWSLSCQQHPL
jgi:hypothetical protein